MNIGQFNLLKKRIDEFLKFSDSLKTHNAELIDENITLKQKLELFENSSKGKVLNKIQLLEKENERLKSNNTEARQRIEKLLSQLESQ